jgi:hypothetical protein
MKRLLVVAAIAVIAAPALAGSEILPIDGVGYLSYNVQTGKVTPVEALPRDLGAPIWITDYSLTTYFWGAEPFLGEAGHEWADVDGSRPFGGFGFTEFTNSQSTTGDLWAVICMYEEENGWDSSGRVYVVGYLINNIPGSTHPPDEYWGYIWGVEPVDDFVLAGSDMDGDGLGDFGYFQFFSGRDAGCLHGPAIAGALGLDPNNLPPECPGVEDAFDLFADVSWNSGPNNIDPNNLGTPVGTMWFGGLPLTFSQFYFALYAPVCPNRGDSGYYCEADIAGEEGPDCIVGLADLAQLLGNYGCGTPTDPNCVATLMMGDVEPYDPWWPGDGDVDLADLALLLAQYGDDCNWP